MHSVADEVAAGGRREFARRLASGMELSAESRAPRNSSPAYADRGGRRRGLKS
jgi:hypothetical protein